MLKKMAAVLIALLLLAGCKGETRQLDEEKYSAYLTYYQNILDYEDKAGGSDNFSITLVANKISDSKFRYDVVINEPKIAMYGIKVLAVIENISGSVDTTVMMPSIGIFEAAEYSMIPFQVDSSRNFVKGLDLSFLSSENPVYVSVMVSYSDKAKTDEHREYFTLTASYQEEEPPAEGNGQ